MDLDCWINDFMAAGDEDIILTEEGYKIIKDKYRKEIDKFFQEMDDSAAEGNNNVKHNMDWSFDLPLTEEELAQPLCQTWN